MIKTELLVEKGNNRTLTKNYAFTSASSAASIAMGRAANGGSEWKLQGTTQTYKQWEADQL